MKKIIIFLLTLVLGPFLVNASENDQKIYCGPAKVISQQQKEDYQYSLITLTENKNQLAFLCSNEDFHDGHSGTGFVLEKGKGHMKYFAHLYVLVFDDQGIDGIFHPGYEIFINIKDDVLYISYQIPPLEEENFYETEESIVFSLYPGQKEEIATLLNEALKIFKNDNTKQTKNSKSKKTKKSRKKQAPQKRKK